MKCDDNDSTAPTSLASCLIAERKIEQAFLKILDGALQFWYPEDNSIAIGERRQGMKYKVGDKVKIKPGLKPGSAYGNYYFSLSMASFIGYIATIQAVYEDCYDIDLDDKIYQWTDEMFEPVEEKEKTMEKFTRKDLQTCMFGETSDGSIFVVAGNLLVYENGGYDCVYDLLEDLSFKYSDEEVTIDRVVKECKSFDMYKKRYGVEVFNRLKPMTLKEIEKALGYRIRLVEEKE